MIRSLVHTFLVAAIAIIIAPDPGSRSFGFAVAFADDDDRRRSRAKRGGKRAGRAFINVPRLKRRARVARPSRARASTAARRGSAVIVGRNVIPGEIVVGEVTSQNLAQILADGFRLITSAPATLSNGVIARLAMPEGMDLAEARERIRRIVPAAIVDENHLYRPVAMRCSARDCPAFEMVNWAVPPARCEAEVKIGMIDTHVNVGNRALAGQAIEKIPLTAGRRRTSSTLHGTAIAALLVGKPSSKTPGLLPSATLLVAEAFHRDRFGDVADVYSVVRAIDALAQRGVRIVNMSFAGPANDLLERAVALAASRNMVLVAAAGNAGPNASPAYPAGYDAVVAVTAIDRDGRIYRHAVRGEHIRFAAPGVRILTASASGAALRSGTSYASPFVSAAFAAFLSDQPAAKTDELVATFAGRAADLGEAGRDPVFGWGLIQASPCRGATTREDLR